MATIVVIYALQARRLSDLRPWLTHAPQLEMTAADIGPEFTLAEYIERESRVFEETRTQLLSSIPVQEQVPGNRYWEGSPNYQWKFATDWNRTFELVPASLERMTWQDWLAATRLGASAMRSKTGRCRGRTGLC